MLALVDDDLVSEVVVWRLDRLSRDVGDLNELIRRFEQHCVGIHSVNDGRVDLATGPDDAWCVRSPAGGPRA
jgi:DNA invertase Pin-like site-specific DNA recombinase